MDVHNLKEIVGDWNTQSPGVYATIQKAIRIGVLIPMKRQEINYFQVEKAPHCAVNYIPKWNNVYGILQEIGPVFLIFYPNLKT